MGDFEKSFQHTIMMEGGYSNNKKDKGGKTMYGITERVARQSGYDGDMKDLSLNKAKEIYKKWYWNPNKLDDIKNDDVATEIFDTGVNMGIGIASRFMQESVNLIDYKNKIVIDGKVGSKTIKAVNKQDPYFLLKALNGLQFMRYYRIVENNPDQEIFFKGWLRRID